ncbi:MAG: sugar ABC transporter permease [Spirochaetes bacterium RBG_13_68_11]|nr:MAG: sugar ABC transporter permease [Spirochaetes bacterium RBG_13_68_11]
MPRTVQGDAVRRVLGIAGRVIAYLVMGTFALMTVAPLAWLVLNSFKSTPEYRLNKLSLPSQLAWVNYSGAWEIGEFSKLIGNSFIYTLGATLGIMFLAILAGFAFAKIRSKATPIIYGSFVLGILLSIQSLMVPIFIEVSQLDRLLGGLLQVLRVIKSADGFHLFYNSRIGVLLIYIGSGLPVALYMSTAYVRGIPDALVEAARIDGAGYFRIFRGIIFPMCVPIATTVAILNITGIWNEFALINILVSKTELKSIPLGVYRFTGVMMADYGKQFAALVIGMAPMLVFYIIFRKQITKGVSAGAVKG